jgi:hypothetical protein
MTRIFSSLETVKTVTMWTSVDVQIAGHGVPCHQHATVQKDFGRWSRSVRLLSR